MRVLDSINRRATLRALKTLEVRIETGRRIKPELENEILPH